MLKNASKPLSTFCRYPERTVLGALLPTLVVLLLATTAFAQEPDTDLDQQLIDASPRGAIRDNTRVSGTVFDAAGEPLTDVNIWVTNDKAPANRMRVRVRKTGSYLVRNMSRLYTQDDVYGIVLRLSFEKPGYRPVEAKVGVEKNGLQEIYPILFPADVAEPEMEGICAKLVGRVEDARGKPVKKGTVRLTSADDELDMAVELKKGVYEALLWNSPRELKVSVEADGIETEDHFLRLAPPPQVDAFGIQTFDIQLGKG